MLACDPRNHGQHRHEIGPALTKPDGPSGLFPRQLVCAVSPPFAPLTSFERIPPPGFYLISFFLNFDLCFNIFAYCFSSPYACFFLKKALLRHSSSSTPSRSRPGRGFVHRTLAANGFPRLAATCTPPSARARAGHTSVRHQNPSRRPAGRRLFPFVFAQLAQAEWRIERFLDAQKNGSHARANGFMKIHWAGLSRLLAAIIRSVRSY